ncbi:Feline leukemia virus subgroup C receptor [Fasciolopsis buskii]|uniref:Feline leukemia virus subgroup C receptor n=1 Tax=Fasciolopsis buskii TaxID=27845 RepID=A0A8E0RKE3_9TREM|nr:Feline leukemia virus subgroup C receptor [Fasciolopsis buski]
MVSYASLSEPVRNPRYEHKTYLIRWFIVAFLGLVNGSNAYLWISFAPIADHFLAYYSTNEQFLNWVQLIFPITTVLLGLPAAFLVDRFGVRFVLVASVTVNLLCGLLRVMSSIASLNPFVGHRLALIIIGQLVASLAQPLCMFTPAKLALDWFPENQRTIANTIGSLGNAVGVLVGSAVAPLIVQRPEDIPVFNYISLGLVGVDFIVCCLMVRRGKPPIPPSDAAAILDEFHQREIQPENFCAIRCFKNFILQCIEPLRSRDFFLLMLTFGCGLAYFTTLSTLFQQILCTKGYSNQFAGLCGSLMIATGLIASIFSAIFADRTGLLLEAMQVGSHARRLVLNKLMPPNPIKCRPLEVV